MKFKIFIVAALLALAPAAHSQDGCAAYRGIAAAAANRFKDAKGPPLDVPGAPGPTFLSKLTAPGLQFCVITLAKDPSLACREIVGSEEAGRALYDKLSVELRSCFPALKTVPLANDGQAGTEMIIGQKLVGQEAAGELDLVLGFLKIKQGLFSIQTVTLGFLLRATSNVS